MRDATINMARIAWPVTSLGPGRRLALWVAGCPLDCRGCITPELQPPAAGRAIAVQALARHILAVPMPLDGVTLTGGEPFEQGPALAALWQSLAAVRPAWDLLVFTGYPHRHLCGRLDARRLLGAADLLIAGPYLADRPGSFPLLASANQRMVALTERGRGLAARCDRPQPLANIGARGDGSGWLIGVLDESSRRRLHRRLGVVPLAGRAMGEQEDIGG